MTDHEQEEREVRLCRVGVVLMVIVAVLAWLSQFFPLEVFNG